MAMGSGADLIWKVGDLGIVRVIGNKTATMTTNRQGSPFYVPPEAYSGEVSPGMDLWALGVTITQVLTGKVPFPGPSEAEVVNQVLNQEPVLPQIEDTLAAIVRGCLVKDRKKRWTPSQVLEALSPQRSNPTDTWWDLDAVPLESEKEMDYTTLRDLLKTEQWKRADQETSRIFCQLTPWNRDGYLTIEDIQQLPCTDLITIDKLWNTASRGFYGFSVQKEIYINCGGSLSDKYPGDRVWHKFCQQIGWRINHRWLLYKNLNFRHPKHHGHFPRGRLGKRKWQRFFAIISRFAKCSP
jgi:serine/threonine protein kinase